MSNIKNSILIVIFLALSTESYAKCPLREGDIIFQETQNTQSKYIKKVTRSPWTHVGSLIKQKNAWKVIEAVQPVRITPLATFVKRSVNNNLELKRYYSDKGEILTKKQISLLNAKLFEFLNLPYDTLFDWDDEKIYCSELIYKSFQRALNIEIGQIQKIKDLNYNYPDVIQFAKTRYAQSGRKFDLNTWTEQIVLTPDSMYQSKNLKAVKINPLDVLKSCR